MQTKKGSLGCCFCKPFCPRSFSPSVLNLDFKGGLRLSNYSSLARIYMLSADFNVPYFMFQLASTTATKSIAN